MLKPSIKMTGIKFDHGYNQKKVNKYKKTEVKKKCRKKNL